MKLAGLFSCVLCLVIGASSLAYAQGAPKGAPKGAAKAGAAPEKNAVSPDAFPNAAAALDALRAGLENNDREAVFKAEGWFAVQKEKVAPDLVRIAQDEGAALETRVLACRALGRTGPGSAAGLLETIKSDKTPLQVKVKAVDSLGSLKPPSRECVDGLVSLLASEHGAVRVGAARGLGRIGPPARSSADALVKILNDTKQDETLRGEAKRALKEVDPRRGLMSIAPKK